MNSLKNGFQGTTENTKYLALAGEADARLDKKPQEMDLCSRCHGLVERLADAIRDLVIENESLKATLAGIGP